MALGTAQFNFGVGKSAEGFWCSLNISVGLLRLQGHLMLPPSTQQCNMLLHACAQATGYGPCSVLSAGPALCWEAALRVSSPAAGTRPARPRWALLSNSQTLSWRSGTSATCWAGFCRVPACHPSLGGCTGLPLGSGALRACWVRLRVPGCRPCPPGHPARAGLGGALGSSRWGRWEK